MSDMIERVAKALAIHQFQSEDAWEDQVAMARAAIEAMREPTDAMVGAGLACEDTDLISEYRAMVDGALK